MKFEGETVHIVDDDSGVRESLRMLLDAEGYRCFTWPSGDGFLSHLADASPGCVLLDLHMNGIDGLQVQAVLKQSKRNFPAIMISAHGDPTLTALAIRVGAVDFLRKPFPKADLLEALSEAFERNHCQLAKVDLRSVSLARLSALDRTEKAVLGQLASGRTNRMAAMTLGIDLDRLDITRASIVAKLGVPTIARAIRLAFDARE